MPNAIYSALPLCKWNIRFDVGTKTLQLFLNSVEAQVHLLAQLADLLGDLLADLFQAFQDFLVDIRFILLAKHAEDVDTNADQADAQTDAAENRKASGSYFQEPCQYLGCGNGFLRRRIEGRLIYLFKMPRWNGSQRR